MSTIETYRKGFYCPKCWSKNIQHHFIYTTITTKKESTTSLKLKFNCLECGHTQQLT